MCIYIWVLEFRVGAYTSLCKKVYTPPLIPRKFYPTLHRSPSPNPYTLLCLKGAANAEAAGPTSAAKAVLQEAGRKIYHAP